MKNKIYLAILLICFVMVGCGKAASNNEASIQEKDDEKIKELVSEYSLGKIKDESASITSEHLIVKKSDGKEVTYDLPKKEFFVSIAPYINETHP